MSKPTMTKEFGQVTPEERSTRTILETLTTTTEYGHTIDWTLSHISVGYVLAGSCMRYQDVEVWKVTAFIDNAIHGQAFKTLAEAKAWLASKELKPGEVR